MDAFVVTLVVQLILYWGISFCIVVLVQWLDAGTRRDFSSAAQSGSVMLVLFHSFSYLLNGPDNYYRYFLQFVTSDLIRGAKPFIGPLIIVWVSGSILLLVRLVRSYRKAARLLEGAEQWGPWVWVSNKVEMPVALGLRTPKVLMPVEAKNWPTEKLRAIAFHERAHIRKGDVLSTFWVNLSCALFWPIPLVWIVSNWFRRDVEMTADDAVLQNGIPAERYAELLLQVAGSLDISSNELSVVAMTRGQGLEGRIRSILDREQRRAKRIEGISLIPLFVFQVLWMTIGRIGPRA